MSSWNELLAPQAQTLTTTQLAVGFVAPIPDQGLIALDGEESSQFLHGQLTQDFALLGQDQARLAAFCNAKGRMQASFIGFKSSPTEILLLCHRDLLAPTLKRLSMFVMRAKAKLTDATADFALYGLVGEGIAPAQPAWTLASAGDASSFAQGLQKAGYATDPNYANKLTSIIKRSLAG